MSIEASQTERDGDSTRRGVVDVTGVKLQDLEATLRGEGETGDGQIHLERQNGRTYLVTERPNGRESSGSNGRDTKRVEIIDLR